MKKCSATINGKACDEYAQGMLNNTEPRCKFHFEQDMTTFLMGAHVTIYTEIPQEPIETINLLENR